MGPLIKQLRRQPKDNPIAINGTLHSTHTIEAPKNTVVVEGDDGRSPSISRRKDRQEIEI